jgi:hypothetical protein
MAADYLQLAARNTTGRFVKFGISEKTSSHDLDVGHYALRERLYQHVKAGVLTDARSSQSATILNRCHGLNLRALLAYTVCSAWSQRDVCSAWTQQDIVVRMPVSIPCPDPMSLANGHAVSKSTCL